MKKTATVFLTVVSILPLIHAVQTQSVLHSVYEDFIKGEFENVSLGNEGHIQLAPALTEWVEIDEPIIWAAVADNEGNLYLGTGNRGKVLKVDTEGEVTDYFSPEEILSRALAMDEEGNLYVGTSPVGRVYRIAPGGRPEIFFDPEDSYIWDFTFDSEGNFYVATGSSATIYKLPPNFQPGDEPVEWFRCDQTHLTTLAWDNQERLLAGSSPEGILYRISGEGEGFALFNSGAQEIKQISVMDDGKIYFATFETKYGNGGSSSSLKTSSSRGEEEPFVVRANPGGGANSNGKKRDKKNGPVGSGMIFSLDENGFVEAYWGLPKANIFSFVRTASGKILVGTNDDGRIFSIASRGYWKLLQQAPRGGEVSVFQSDPLNDGNLLTITSNPAGIYRLEGKPSAEGKFTSEPVDAGQIAQWGSIKTLGGQGQSGNGVLLRTRTGNTEEPDDTWAPWEESAAAEDRYRVSSPNARFLQYEIAFSNEGEGVDTEGDFEIRQIRLFYQTGNAPPQVAAIRIIPAGFEILQAVTNSPNIDLLKLLEESNPENLLRKPIPRQQLRNLGEEGLMTIAWKAFDPNGDNLEFGLSIKGVGDTDWITLVDELEEPVYTFNTRGFEDGYYLARVMVSDRLDNETDRARSGERLSELFLIDNSPPAIELLDPSGEIGHQNLPTRFRVSDELSVLRAVYYTLDGQKARSLRPDDGLFDAREENFSLALEDLKPGSHSLLLEAFDEIGRATVLSLTFERVP